MTSPRRVATIGKVMTDRLSTNGGKSRVVRVMNTHIRVDVSLLSVSDMGTRRRRRMRISFGASLVLAISSLAFLPVSGGRVDASIRMKPPRALNPVTTVTIRPPYGYYRPPVTVRLSATERRVIARLARESREWNAPDADIGRPVEWHIEASARSSPTLALAQKVLANARSFLAWDGQEVPVAVDIVVGRTQDFLTSTLARLGCRPRLTADDGVFLMGATICSGTVIVINLTGYLFVRTRDQKITPYLERLREPAVSNTWYLIVDRNMRSLAHEWVHIARFSPVSLRIARDEPAWLREGMAETLSGIAAVRATGGRLSYLEHYVISVRKFSRWTATCDRPLREYRTEAPGDGGCEYFAGAAASSLLLADHGGLTRLHELYRAANAIGNWVTAFASVYEMTLEQFEAKADRFIAQIRTLTA